MGQYRGRALLILLPTFTRIPESPMVCSAVHSPIPQRLHRPSSKSSSSSSSALLLASFSSCSLLGWLISPAWIRCCSSSTCRSFFFKFFIFLAFSVVAAESGWSEAAVGAAREPCGALGSWAVSPRDTFSRVRLKASASPFSCCCRLFSFRFRLRLAVFERPGSPPSGLDGVTGAVASGLSPGGSSGLLLKNFTYLFSYLQRTENVNSFKESLTFPALFLTFQITSLFSSLLPNSPSVCPQSPTFLCFAACVCAGVEVGSS